MTAVATKTIRLAADLALPIDIAVEKTALLGKSGRGKTYTAKRMVEEVLKAGVPVAVIDPTDVWYGLGAGPDGTARGGLDVVVFGGRHGDLPLNEHAGKMLAHLVLGGTSMVIVTKSLPKAARRRLIADFLTELYDKAVGSPLLVVVDEADEYAPQNTFGQVEVAKCLGALEDVVRRGRAGGLGSLLISQRPAVLNKDVLEQVDVLIVLGMTGKNDIGAIDVWVGRHADETEAQQIKPSLPGLPRGEAWVWGPELGILQRIKVAPISTFDSSRSPKIGEKPIKLISRKSIDLDALGAEMAQLVKEVQSTDPKLLRKKITELELQLCAKSAVLKPEIQRVEVPVLDEALAQRLIDKLTDVVITCTGINGDVRGMADEISVSLSRWNSAPAAPQPASVEQASPRRARQPQKAQSAVPQSPAAVPVDPSLGRAARALLTALAPYEGKTRTTAQLCMATGYKVKSSTVRNALSQLRTAGCIIGSGDSITITAAGLQALGGYTPLPTGRALLEYWLESNALGKAARAMLFEIASAYPKTLTAEQVARLTGYEPTSSTVRNALSQLRTMSLISGGGTALLASEELID